MFPFLCKKCGKELDKPGSLVIGPPSPGQTDGSVCKWHICFKCYIKLIDWILDD